MYQVCKKHNVKENNITSMYFNPLVVRHFNAVKIIVCVCVCVLCVCVCVCLCMFVFIYQCNNEINP